ncbi:MAG: serine protease [bacterium]
MSQTFKNLLKILGFFILAMAAAILANQAVWPYLAERPVYITEKKEIFIQENTALTDAIAKAEKSIVGVKTKIKSGQLLEGSALSLTADGLAITLADLVPLGGNFVFFDSEGNATSSLPFQILKRDSKANLALVKLGGVNLSSVSFSSFEEIRLGERVFLVGVSSDQKIMVNEGIVKSLNKDNIETNIIEKANLAGSPLFDIEGNLLGINTIAKDGRVNAIPVAIIRQFTGF